MKTVGENNNGQVINQSGLPVVENKDNSTGTVCHFWQKATKVVGLINMTMGSIGCVVVLNGTAGLVYAVIETKGGRMFEDTKESAEENDLFAIFAVLLIISASTCSIELYAGIVLQHATSNVEHVYRRLTMCQTSRNTHAILFLLTCTLLIPTRFSIFTWLLVTLRIFYLLIICKHIQELEQHAQVIKLTKLWYIETV